MIAVSGPTRTVESQLRRPRSRRRNEDHAADPPRDAFVRLHTATDIAC